MSFSISIEGSNRGAGLKLARDERDGRQIFSIDDIARHLCQPAAHFAHWQRDGGRLNSAKQRLGAGVDELGRLDWNETFADGSFAPAKKGAPASARLNAERVQSGWWWQAAKVFLWEFNLPVRPRMKRP